MTVATLTMEDKIRYYLEHNGKQNHEGLERKKVLTTFLHELAHQKQVILDSPLIAGIIVTDRCNLSCPHCFSDNCASMGGTTEELKGLIDQLADAGIISMYMTGGEPFLRPDLEELIAHAKQKRLYLTVHTNGILLNEKRVKRLAEVMNFDEDEIQVSIDGSTAEIFNKMRDGDFDRMVRNCRLLQEHGAPLKINVTVTNHNFHDLANLYRLAADLKAKTIGFSPLLLTNTNDPTQTWLPSTEELLTSFVEALQVAEELGFPVRISQDPLAVPCGVPELKEAFSKMEDQTPWYFCPAGTSAIEIDVNGNVYPCPYLRYDEFKAGNVHEESLKEIWARGTGWDSFRNIYLGETEKCPSCTMKKSCRGACAAQSFHMGLTLDDADPRCDLIQLENV